MTEPGGERFARGRHAGVIVPLFSMPSTRSWGIGDIGDIAAMASWLRTAAQDVLQLLPVSEMARGQRSPYSAMSAMAIDPIYITVPALADFQALGGEQELPAEARATLADLRRAPRIQHAAARALKETALRAAFDRFLETAWRRSSARAGELGRYITEQAWWLDDYALFRALHHTNEGVPWQQWETGLRDRDAAALESARQRLAHEILYRQYLQWVADDQWQQARRMAAPVALFGDFAFMVDTDSADVWARQREFRLDATVGAPPDAFSETGQNWGLPGYDWDVQAVGGFEWLRQRARRTAALVDGYRIDHLVGFFRTYMWPRGAAQGAFTPGEEAEQLALGERLLSIFKEAGAYVTAEDLGTVPDFVRAALARAGIPGYKVLRWEREWHAPGQPFRNPLEYPEISVATSSTHDTATLAAWWNEASRDEREAFARIPSLSGIDPEGGYTPGLRDRILELLVASRSQVVLLLIHDLFGWRERINTPASMSPENWTYRLPWPVDRLDEQPDARERAKTLAEWCIRHGRA